MSQQFSDAPPPYSPIPSASASSSGNDRLQVPTTTPRQRKARNGISTSARRSMEDEQRPLPKGWIRQLDQRQAHHFYVDTTTNPPRSIWHHPYDDERYLSTLSSEDRERIQQEHISAPGYGGDTTDEEGDYHTPAKSAAKGSSGASTASGALQEKPSLGRRLKDKVTHSTHEEREAERRQRAAEEQRAYEQHQKVRAAMSKAMETGQPVLVGRDRDGKDVYVTPPQQGMGMYGGGGGVYGNSVGYSPYAQGVYANPNARYITPQVPYGRPYGYGYGGGLGMPIAGGLLGGLLLGGLLF